MKVKSLKVMKDVMKNSNGIKREVIKDALEVASNIEDFVSYLKDVSEHGCVSGICTSLIAYADTEKFYDTYEEEIEDMLEEYRVVFGAKNRLELISTFNGAENVGSVLQEKNLLAWFAYEERARQILKEYFDYE